MSTRLAAGHLINAVQDFHLGDPDSLVLSYPAADAKQQSRQYSISSDICASFQSVAQSCTGEASEMQLDQVQN